MKPECRLRPKLKYCASDSCHPPVALINPFKSFFCLLPEAWPVSFKMVCSSAFPEDCQMQSSSAQRPSRGSPGQRRNQNAQLERKMGSCRTHRKIWILCLAMLFIWWVWKHLPSSTANRGRFCPMMCSVRDGKWT